MAVAETTYCRMVANSSGLHIDGGDGNDLLLNIVTGRRSFMIQRRGGDDIFENRGERWLSLQCYGGDGDDAFYQNVGSPMDIELDGERR